MFGQTRSINMRILEAAKEAQTLIDILFRKDPTNEVFEQAGMLDGTKIVCEFIEYNEQGLALEHIFYMIDESGIPFPKDRLEELNKLASEMTANVTERKN